MAQFEARMIHYEGPELKRVEPTLVPSQKRVIALFHDECCFHVNDYKKSAWYGFKSAPRTWLLNHLNRLREDETILQKKGRGRLIHVSDFINPETGHLIRCNSDGTIIEDARKIIYPGSNGDAWWDTAQLLDQVKQAITIFEAAHPNCVALFIFDQSSAHASPAPDALRAFDMNKSNGGKQRKQQDTVIPQSNPVAELRGKPQKMTLENGNPKGLQQVLEERGFNVCHLRAKCSPVCPFESKGCCMSQLLSQQDDFVNQPSMLESLIRDAGHECIFLPKFHCELNLIEMVCGSIL
jgi:hypothetical protein